MLQTTAISANQPVRVSSNRSSRIALFAIWLVIVAYLATHHVFWRDEVRALSLALTGDNVIQMAKAVHGEGHPLLWYLLLRGAHVIAPVREVLPMVGLAVGTAGAGFFAWRAPFRPLILAAVLFGGWMTYEYTVMARNYGISMLLMFVIADRLARGRDGALAMGGLLFLLCNTNVPSVILAGGFLLFWLVEIVSTQGWRWNPALARWAGATTIMLAGVGVCFATVYPPFNDAATAAAPGSATLTGIIGAMVNISEPLSALWREPFWGLPLLILGGSVGLARRPGGAIAAIVVLPMLLLFFQLIYPGSYRHEALYLCFAVALRWATAGGRGGRWGERLTAAATRDPQIAALLPTLSRRGWSLFVALLLVQLGPTLSLLVQVAEGRVEGQSQALAEVLAKSGLRHAIVMSVPDVMVEALPYYTGNPTFLLRRRRFEAFTHFTRHADLHLTLGGILATGRRLQAVTGRPVVILMQYPLVRDAAEHRWIEGILGDFTARPGETAAFLDATRRIARPVELIRYGFFDESYDVYVLKPGVTGS